MKEYLLLNTTYYITKYNLSNPIFKILIFFIISISIRQGLDASNYAFCMEDNPLEEVPRPKRVTFDPSISQDDSAYYKNKLMRCKKELIHYKAKVGHLKQIIEEHRIEAQVINSMLHEEVRALQGEIRALNSQLAIAQSEASHFSKLLRTFGFVFKKSG